MEAFTLATDINGMDLPMHPLWLYCTTLAAACLLMAKGNKERCVQLYILEHILTEVIVTCITLGIMGRDLT